MDPTGQESAWPVRCGLAIMLSSQLPVSALDPACPTGVVPRYIPTFDRVLLEVETIVKSTSRLKGWPETQEGSGSPVRVRGFDAMVRLTSLAVQPRFWLLPAAVNKSCAQVPDAAAAELSELCLADAGDAPNNSANAAMTRVSEYNPV